MTRWILSTIENQYGDEIPSREVREIDGVFYLVEISCLSADRYNLGNCRCVNHDAISEDVITRERANELVVEAGWLPILEVSK